MCQITHHTAQRIPPLARSAYPLVFSRSGSPFKGPKKLRFLKREFPVRRGRWKLLRFFLVTTKTHRSPPKIRKGISGSSADSLVHCLSSEARGFIWPHPVKVSPRVLVGEELSVSARENFSRPKVQRFSVPFPQKKTPESQRQRKKGRKNEASGLRRHPQIARIRPSSQMWVPLVHQNSWYMYQNGPLGKWNQRVKPAYSFPFFLPPPNGSPYAVPAQRTKIRHPIIRGPALFSVSDSEDFLSVWENKNRPRQLGTPKAPKTKKKKD